MLQQNAVNFTSAAITLVEISCLSERKESVIFSDCAITRNVDWWVDDFMCQTTSVALVAHHKTLLACCTVRFSTIPANLHNTRVLFRPDGVETGPRVKQSDDIVARR